MCRISVRHTPNPGAFTEIGDIATVIDDSQEFGRREDIRVWEAEFGSTAGFPDETSIIDIPGMPLETGLRLMQTWIRQAVPGDAQYNPDSTEYVWIGPNRWQLGKQDRLPPLLSQKLDNDRFLVLPYDIPTINNYMIDRAGLDVLITDTPIDP